MGRSIRVFSDGSLLEYDSGKFDDWCVYLKRPQKVRYAPLDIQYFSDLINYSTKYSPDSIYKDFILIYNATDKKIDNNVLQLINTISQKYSVDGLEIEIVLTIIYAGMVAEENKQYTRLGKRVKRLGVHQVLFEGLKPNQAANFSKGKKWREIAAECVKRGF